MTKQRQQRNVLLLGVVCLMTMTCCIAFTASSTYNHQRRTCSSLSSSSSLSCSFHHHRPRRVLTATDSPLITSSRMGRRSSSSLNAIKREKSFFGRQLEELAKKKGISLDGSTGIEKPSTPSESSSSDKPKPKYQRIEDWEQENQLRRANGTMSWEEKVQFDGLTHGNQVRQNEILQKFLR